MTFIRPLHVTQAKNLRADDSVLLMVGQFTVPFQIVQVFNTGHERVQITVEALQLGTAPPPDALKRTTLWLDAEQLVVAAA